MWLWRTLHDKTATVPFPKPITVGRRRLWKRSDLEAYEHALVRQRRRIFDQSQKQNPQPWARPGVQGEEANSRSHSYTKPQQRQATSRTPGGRMLWVFDDRSDGLTCTEIVSRYSLNAEYKVLTAMINALQPELRRQVVAVICDSKQTHSYGVQLDKWNQKSAERIALAN